LGHQAARNLYGIRTNKRRCRTHSHAPYFDKPLAMNPNHYCP
jgi:hypothetical protein